MSNARFGEAAARLASAAALALGWRPGEFWNSTPAELAVAFEPPGAAPEPVSSDVFEALKQRFPDDERG